MAQFEFKPQTLHRTAQRVCRGESLDRPYEDSDERWTTIETPTPAGVHPLVVDLDGTLIATDLLIETAFSELGRRPHGLFDMLRALAHGKAALKHRLAEPVDFDPGTLPYDPEVLSLIRDARTQGRPIYLASASHENLVSKVAAHLCLFNGWFASNETSNLAGDRKTAQLVETFGERGFDYVGNDAADLPVWDKAARAYAIRASARVRRQLALKGTEIEHLPCSKPDWRIWAKMLRVHQYAKNALVFLPLLTSHYFTAEVLAQALLAFVAFSLCASSVYILNDLVDLQDDRRHSSKCNRPLACGAIPLTHGVVAIPILLLSSIATAAALSLPFLGVLLGYFALTTAYSFALKRLMIIDVITLAGLYSVRVIGGAVATGVVVSEWLLAFCMMFFMSLALIKRYVELAARRDASLPDPTSRGYKNADIDIVAALTAGAGFNAVTIFTLYVSSDAVNELYTHPQILWLVGPLLMYWIARALIMARRRLIDDDPVVFAIKDKVSLITAGTTVLLVLSAI